MAILRPHRRCLLSLMAASSAVMVSLAPAGSASSPGLGFSAPVRLTAAPFGGYEPGIKIDRYGNVFVTAHKQNFIDAASPDPNAPTRLRSASWLWTSSDGVHFHDLPGLTAVAANNLEFGDEGDLALDHADNLYFIDTSVTDVAVSQWHIGGLGDITLKQTVPAIASAQPVDDRPWIAATGNRDVAYVSNEGDKISYPLASQLHQSNALGPGRDTVYMSHDGGRTFDHIGVTLRDSGWCKPASNPQPRSRALYVVCTNDSGANGVTDNPGGGGFYHGVLYCYASYDAGTTWARFRVGSYDGLSSGTWPDVNVDSRGVVRALFVDPQITDSGDERDVLELWTSRTAGRTWQKEVIATPDHEVPYSALSVAPDGSVGVAYYSRSNPNANWDVYAAVRRLGAAWRTSQVSTTPIGPPSGPYGDFFQIAFDPQSRLSVVWTVVTNLGPTNPATTGSDSDIYYARQR